MLYNLAIALYALAVHIAALFSRKPRLLVRGHRKVGDTLRSGLKPGVRYIWFHASSLGEFEQGRPLMEAIRARYPQYGILLTFFSPSGYEVRKNYAGADVVCYLPFDHPWAVRRFIDLAQPCMAFFIKYEFWKNYLDELRRRHIPVYSVSSIFRPGQIFFRWYGGTYRLVLRDFDHLFVQNEESRRYLSAIDIRNVTVVGDTRFDRVVQICRQSHPLPLAEAFSQGGTRGSLTVVAGSSWPADEALLIDYFNTHPQMRLIIAPHVVSESHVHDILGRLHRPSVRYTEADEQSCRQADCLIVDCYGTLSAIYRYGQVAYVGGGFGAGIHNTLEAAVYGMPVIFGPRYGHFREAVQLIEAGGAFSIKGQEQLTALLDAFATDPAHLAQAGQAAGQYVGQSAGATATILNHVFNPK